jgi:hypothetical protein
MIPAENDHYRGAFAAFVDLATILRSECSRKVTIPSIWSQKCWTARAAVFG